eukprot:TRINITY_DN13912_c0_g1_i10.p2 TRINITY_DN13912_c0_g1~~TRINITY_DN13912_c0_g1_i10.p2  ORF type:complete len:218 (+),score=-16.98 TRINITY_DN13912_c0_g1_i10:540-1193(+)
MGMPRIITVKSQTQQFTTIMYFKFFIQKNQSPRGLESVQIILRIFSKNNNSSFITIKKHFLCLAPTSQMFLSLFKTSSQMIVCNIQRQQKTYIIGKFYNLRKRNVNIAESTLLKKQIVYFVIKYNGTYGTPLGHAHCNRSIVLLTIHIKLGLYFTQKITKPLRYIQRTLINEQSIQESIMPKHIKSLGNIQLNKQTTKPLLKLMINKIYKGLKFQNG